MQHINELNVFYGDTLVPIQQALQKLIANPVDIATRSYDDNNDGDNDDNDSDDKDDNSDV